MYSICIQLLNTTYKFLNKLLIYLLLSTMSSIITRLGDASTWNGLLPILSHITQVPSYFVDSRTMHMYHMQIKNKRK